MYKVLYVSPNGYLGGAERFVVTAAIAHGKRKNVNASILFFSNGEACLEAQKFGVQCFVLKTSFRMRSLKKLFHALREIRKIVKEQRPDILHLTMPYSHIMLSLATLGLGIKKVWFQHGPVRGSLDRIANLFPVDMIWYNSTDLKMRHHQTWPSAHVRFQESIIKLGVESHLEAHQLFSAREIKLGTAGRICSWKGFHTSIEALGHLKKEQGLVPFKFYIAGDAKTIQDKKYSEDLRQLVESHDLTEEVVFLEHVENMEAFYQGLDIFIHSSLIPEPFGLVVAEAMANGCLVIGSDLGGVRDLLKNEVTGISFPSTGKAATQELKIILAKILTGLNTEEIETLKKMARDGRSLVENEYSLEQMMNSVESFYLQMLQKKR